MAKTKISEFSTTPGNNTDINGINIAEGCAPSGINNAIRELMSDLKEWQSGAMDVYVIPQGTAAAPGIQLYGDLDTGLYGYAANQLGVAVGGASAGYFSSDGWVGNVNGTITGDINATTIDTTNLEVTNIKAKDGTAAITIADSTGVVTISNAVTMSATTQNIALGTSQTTGTYTVGGTAQTGTQSIGRSTKAHTFNVATGATESGATKTVNIATAGVSGSTTTISIGSSVSGATSTTTLSGNVTATRDMTVNGITVGKGNGSQAANTALGLSALAAFTTGESSTAIGQYALWKATTSAFNTAVGAQSQLNSLTGGYNTSVGALTLNTATAGFSNVAIGYSALNLATGDNNTAVGNGAGSLITTGAKNTIIGNYSGNQGGLDITTSSNYIVLSDGDGNPRAYWNGANATLGGTLTATTITGTQINSDNLRLDGNTLSSTDTNGNITIAPNGTGITTFSNYLKTGNLEVGQVALGTNLIKATNTNGGIYLQTNGSGLIFADAESIIAGNASATTKITTNGASDLVLDTNDSSNSGSITIQDGVNGNILISPNGTGQIQLSGALDVTNIEVTNIKAKDGTAALSIADSTGAVTVATALTANGGAVFNENGADVDFRVEGDTDANLIFADASTDRVGIGTNSPGYKLDVSGQARALEGGTGSGNGGLISATAAQNGNAGVLFQTNSASRWNLTTQGTNGANLRFYNYALASSVATFDSSGNLGLGTTSTSSRFEAVAGTGAQDIARFRTGDATAANNAGGGFYANSSATAGSRYAYMWLDADGANFSGLDYFSIYKAGNSGGVEIINSSNSFMTFGTNNTERARITSGGYFKAQGTSTYGSSTGTYHEFVTAQDGSAALIVQSKATNGTQYGAEFNTANDQNDSTRYFIGCYGGATQRFALRSNGGLANYSANNVNLASDLRLKNTIEPMRSYYDVFKNINWVTWLYNDQTDDLKNHGVIAQELQELAPEFVCESNAKEAPEGESPYLGIWEQDFKMAGMSVITELIKKIEKLEAEVAALKGV